MQNLANPYRTLSYVQGVSFAPYTITGSISYLPFSSFIFALTYRLYLFLGEPSRFLYYFLLKQPMVLSDVGVAVMLAKILFRWGDAGSARNAFLIWLYFPLGIVISSVWGQLDSFALFLSLLAIYYFLSSKWLYSALTLGLAIYLKTLPVVFLPVFLIQYSLSRRNKLNYSLISLAIPVVGTFVPALALNWGFRGMYNNVSFQVSIPSAGAMSLLGQIHLFPSVLTAVHAFTGSIWVPVMMVVYVYAWKRNLSLVQGLLIAILAFSISRPFLPEQWSIYPLALLLLTVTADRLEHFVGLGVAAIGFLASNNTLLVRFLSPVSVEAFNWDEFINSHTPYLDIRVAATIITSLLYFTESLLIITGRESMVYRALGKFTLSHALRPRAYPMRIDAV